MGEVRQSRFRWNHKLLNQDMDRNGRIDPHISRRLIEIQTYKNHVLEHWSIKNNYPLVNSHITMESQHFSWENSWNQWQFITLRTFQNPTATGGLKHLNTARGPWALQKAPSPGSDAPQRSEPLKGKSASKWRVKNIWWNLNWLVVEPTPLKNMKVSWGDYSQYMEK